jgi:hypothetical protein
MKLFISLLLIIISTALSAQETLIHIVTIKKNQLPGFPNIHFTVNGIPYKLRAGTCMDLKVNAQTIEVIVTDKRWVKSETESLIVPGGKELFIWVGAIWKGNFKNPQYGAKLCDSCYAEMKKNCR